MPTKGVIYYSDCRPDPKLLKACQDNIRAAFDGEIVSVTLKPMDFGDKRIVLDLERGYLTMFTQILTALEASTADIIFFCEHDNMYPKEHFEFDPPEDKVYYNNNWWKIRLADGFAVSWQADQVSGLVGPRQMLIDWYKKRIETFDPDNFDRKFEPFSGEGAGKWMSEVPYLDLRGKWNLTFSKWELKHFRNKATAVNFQEATIDRIPGWSSLSDILK